MPLRDYPNLTLLGIPAALKQAFDLRSDDQKVVKSLEDSRMRGRLRTGIRTIPASPTDTTKDDIEGDIVTDDTDLYRLVKTTTGLKWHKETLDISW